LRRQSGLTAPSILDDLQPRVCISETETHKNKISLQTRFASDLPPIVGDRVLLQQVILNLIKNAVEAMSAEEEGPRELLVRSGKDGSQGVLVAVLDSGPGLDAESTSHVFDSFYATKPDGMGMCLAISHSIIESHGGRLWATATNLVAPSFSSRCRPKVMGRYNLNSSSTVPICNGGP
jgi:signal transduction histidine kinase